MAHNYVVTVQKPTAIHHTITGNFCAPDELNLVIAKCSSFELYKVDEEGLTEVADVPINGRIVKILFFRPEDTKTDSILLITAKFQFCVLRYDEGKILTTTAGNLAENNSKPSDHGVLAVVDPHQRYLAAHLYDGVIKVLQVGEGGKVGNPNNLTVRELEIMRIAFLHNQPSDAPQLAVLYKDTKQNRHVRVYALNMTKQPWEFQSRWNHQLEAGTTMMIPVPPPFLGVVLVGEYSITHLSHDPESNTVSNKTLRIEPTQFLSYCSLDTEGIR